MARKSAPARGNPARQNPRQSSDNPDLVRAIGGAICLAVAAISAGVLAVKHITGLAVPGCGAESACDQVAESLFGKIPLGTYEWPTAFIGLAYFFALLVAWVWLSGQLTRAQRAVTWLGGLISVALLGVLLYEGKPCPYCVATHVANFAFLGVLLTTRPRAVGGTAGWISGLAALVLMSGAVGAWDGMAAPRATASARKSLANR